MSRLKLSNAKVVEAGVALGNENMESETMEHNIYTNETPKDEDVLKEERVRGLNKADVAIKLVKLRKVFAHPPKVAVSGISVGINTVFSPYLAQMVLEKRLPSTCYGNASNQRTSIHQWARCYGRQEWFGK